jgi:hypothetical protein
LKPDSFFWWLLGGDMKHAGGAALEIIEPMLIELRQLEGIRERKPGVFYKKSSAFIHFHEDPAGIFVDMRRDSEWLRLPVNTSSERRQLVRLVGEILGSK